MLVSLSSIFSLTSRRSTFLEKEISSNILEIEKETRILTNSETDIKGHGNRYKCSTSCTGRAITRGIKSSPVSGTRFSAASASPIPSSPFIFPLVEANLPSTRCLFALSRPIFDPSLNLLRARKKKKGGGVCLRDDASLRCWR